MANSNRDDQALFSVTLTPYRSLGPRGFVVLMIFVGGTCFLAGTLFFALGAWPIVGFLGLDVLAIWFAFRLNYRAAKAFEQVEIFKDRLTVRKVSPAGEISEVELNPRWTRLEIQEQKDEGVTNISLCSGGSIVSVGAFLNPGDRTSFARALRTALLKTRAFG